MYLLITVVVGDLKGISDFLFLLLALTTYGQSGISSSYGRARSLMSLLTVFLLLFFSGFFRGFFGLKTLFSLVGLILGLQGVFVSLIVSRVKTDL